MEALDVPNAFLCCGQRLARFEHKIWAPMSHEKEKNLMPKIHLRKIYAKNELTGSRFRCVCFHRCKRRISHWTIAHQSQRKWIEIVDKRWECWPHSWANQPHSRRRLSALEFAWLFSMVAKHARLAKFSLSRCVSGGVGGKGERYYNELLDLWICNCVVMIIIVECFRIFPIVGGFHLHAEAAYAVFD